MNVIIWIAKYETKGHLQEYDSRHVTSTLFKLEVNLHWFSVVYFKIAVLNFSPQS